MKLVKTVALILVMLYAAGWCIYHTNAIVPHIMKIMEFVYG